MKKIKLNLMKKINLNLKMPMLKVIVIIVNFIGDRAEYLSNYGDKLYRTKIEKVTLILITLRYATLNST